MEESDLLRRIIDILRDDTIDNMRAADELGTLAQEYRSLGPDEQDAVYNQDDAEAMEEFVSAMFERFVLLESPDHGMDVEVQGQLMTAVLKLMPAGITGALAEALFSRQYVDMLCGVMDAVFDLEDVEKNQDSQTLLALILQALNDLAEAELPSGPSQRKRSSPAAQELVGQAVLKTLLKNIPRTKSMRVNVRRGAASLLLALLTHSSANQKLLTEPEEEEALQEVFNTYLVACGDFATQVDLMEMLYRCCKNQLKHAADKCIANPQVRQRFQQMLAKSSKTVDLATELREVLAILNTSAPNPSVHSFLADSIRYSAPELVRAADMWVDLGDQQITFNAKVMEQDTPAGTVDDMAGEPLDFEFRHIKLAQVKDDPDDPRMCVVNLTMFQNPELLESYAPLTAEPLAVTLRARKDVAAPLLSHLPSPLINVASQDEAFQHLSQPQPKADKPKNKMSRGITVYTTSARPQASGAPPGSSAPAQAAAAQQPQQAPVSTVSIPVQSRLANSAQRPISEAAAQTPAINQHGMPAVPNFAVTNTPASQLIHGVQDLEGSLAMQAPIPAANGIGDAVIPPADEAGDAATALTDEANAAAAVATDAANAALGVVRASDANVTAATVAVNLVTTDTTAGPEAMQCQAQAVVMASIANHEPAQQGAVGNGHAPPAVKPAHPARSASPERSAEQEEAEQAEPVAARTRSSGGKSVPGGQPVKEPVKERGKRQTSTGGAWNTKRKTASARKKAPSTYELLAKGAEGALNGAAAEDTAGAGVEEPQGVLLESSPDWLKAAAAAAAVPTEGPAPSEQPSHHSTAVPSPSVTRTFKARSKTTPNAVDSERPARSNAPVSEVAPPLRDPYELRDSQEEEAARKAAAAAAPVAVVGRAGKARALGTGAAKKPGGRLAALGVHGTTPKGKSVTRVTTPAAGEAAPAVPSGAHAAVAGAAATTSAAEPPAAGAPAAASGQPGARAVSGAHGSGSRNSAATAAKEPPPRVTGSYGSTGGAGKQAAGKPPTGKPDRPGLPPAPRSQKPKAPQKQAAPNIHVGSGLDPIEEPDSLPSPKRKVKAGHGKHAPRRGAAAAAESDRDTIENPDSLPDRQQQARSQNGPAKTTLKVTKRAAGVNEEGQGPSVPADSGRPPKRPRREASAKAAQAIREQAVAESPGKGRHKPPSPQTKVPPTTAAPEVPRPSPRSAPAPQPSAHHQAPSLWDYDEDELVDDYAAPPAQRKITPRPAVVARPPPPARPAVQPAPPAAPAAPTAAPAPVAAELVITARLRRQYAELDREQLMAEEEEEEEAEAPVEPAHAREGSGRSDMAPPAAARQQKRAPMAPPPPVARGRQQPPSRPSLMTLLEESPAARKPAPLKFDKSPRPTGAPLLPNKKQLADQQRRKRAGQAIPVVPVAPATSARQAKPADPSRVAAPVSCAEPPAAIEPPQPVQPEEEEVGLLQQEQEEDVGLDLQANEPSSGVIEEEQQVIEALQPSFPAKQRKAAAAAAAALQLPELQLPSELEPVPERPASFLRPPEFRLPELHPGPSAFKPSAQPRPATGLAQPRAKLQIPDLGIQAPAALESGFGAELAPSRPALALPALKLPSLAAPPAAKRRKTTGGIGVTGRIGASLDATAFSQGDSQMAQLAQLLRSQMGGEDEEDEGDNQLLAVIFQTFAKKKQDARAKKEAILEGARARIQQGARDLEARLAKEARAQTSLVARTLSTLDQELQSKFENIQAIQEQFNERMTAAWDEYVAVLGSLETAKREMENLAASRRAAAKRQMAELQQQSEATLKDAVTRAEREEKHARKLSGLPQLLQGLMGG